MQILNMENIKIENKDTKKKCRPAQKLYVPPAQRNKKKVSQNKSPTPPIKADITSKEEISSCEENIIPIEELSIKTNSSSDVNDTKSILNVDKCTNVDYKGNDSTNNDEQSLVIMLDNIKNEENVKNVDDDKEEMERAIVNINRKTRPLIKHVNVGNKDVLHIDIDDRGIKHKNPTHKPKKSCTISDKQVANWEDLFNEDDGFCGEITKQITDYIGDNSTHTEDSTDDEEYQKKSTGSNDLDHVIELYDFPSTFRTQDLMQLYSDVNNDLMYIKWCDETHALLILSTPNQAKRALNIQHGIIKSRAMTSASSIALQVASRVDLKPAMKRPQTNMQTARRLINSHLGTKSKLSKEEYAKEREELQKAKELKRALKQSENDAWDGHPRPSTA